MYIRVPKDIILGVDALKHAFQFISIVVLILYLKIKLLQKPHPFVMFAHLLVEYYYGHANIAMFVE